MKLKQDSVPSTVEEAVDALVAAISDEEKAEIRRGMPSSRCHFSGGMAIRNGWGLWEKGTPLKKDAIEKYGLGHADDISGMIFEWAFAKIRHLPFDPDKHAKRYHQHWKKYGTTSVEAGGEE